MDAGIKQKIAESSFAWFNKVNPAAVMCESFFSLNIYEDYKRYLQCVVTMIITIVVFITLGLLMTRRRKYASL
jgi:ABC-2 type transport system permease protein